MTPFTEIFEDKTKYGTKLETDKYLDEGSYQIIDQGKDEIAGYTNEREGLFDDVPAIVFGDHTRIIKYVTEPFFLGADGVKVLKPKDTNNNCKYLYYALKNVKIPNTGYNRHFKWLKEASFELHSKNKQDEIVEILDRISKIIYLKNKELSNLDNLIKARFVEMFGQGEYPQSTISQLVSGKVSTAKKDFDTEDTIKYIDISSIDNKRNIMTGYTEYILREAPSRAQQHIRKNDIVISTVRPNLRNVAVTSYEDDNLVASSGFCILRPNKCTPEYLMAIVTSEKFTDDMVKVVTGANYPAIKDSDVMNYPVAVAPIDEQIQFADFTKQVDKSKFIN